MNTEKEMIRFLTPFLGLLVCDLNLEIVNSEDFVWVEQYARITSTRLKPDLFITIYGI
jgi:hypothetical protein